MNSFVVQQREVDEEGRHGGGKGGEKGGTPSHFQSSQGDEAVLLKTQ